MFYRNLIITFIMYALVLPVWAELGQEEISEQDLAEAVIDPVLDEISPQIEEITTDKMDSMMTDQGAEFSTELDDIDIDETETSEIEFDKPVVSEIKGRPLIKDVVLVLDNSGSMKKNDPQFLTKQAVTEFINNLDESTRAAIVIFDQDVHLAVPLTDVSSTSRQGILDSLSKINYKGLYTNSPAAIESAIYDLKNNGREEARKVIIFMTDGIVDTGNADRDLEKRKWLKEDLAADASDARIRIFGVAFTENADFELIQSLAQKTEGEYYRALLADDLQNVFSKLNTLINKPDKPDKPEVVTQPEPRVIERIVEKVVEPKPEPIIIEVPTTEAQMADDSERKRSILILVALAVLILAVIAMVLMLLRGSKSKSPEEETAQEAYLNDIQGVTNHATFALGNKPTMLGRVAGKDTEFLNYYVIPEATIGRRHSLIEYKDFSYWIVDQGSINGTFVNDKPVTTEVRLKHGDIIRLHKIEFEFVIPEMIDSGMTVISSTAIADKGITDKIEETSIPGSEPSVENFDDLDDDDLPEPDFDITGEHGSDDPNLDEDTVMKGGDAPAERGPDGSDETIMMIDEDEDDDDITR